MCSVVANSLNFVEGAQIHHPLGRCCAFSEGCRMSGGHPFARTEAERRPCRGQSATSYPTQGAGTLLNKRQTFCYKGAMMMNVHYEACTHLHRTIQQIHAAGMKAGVTELTGHTFVYVRDRECCIQCLPLAALPFF